MHEYNFGFSPFYDLGLVLSNLSISDQGLVLKKFDLASIVRRFADLGMKHIEIPIDYKYFMTKDDFTAVLDEINYLRRKFSMSLSFHLPIYSLELASWNERIRKTCVNIIVESIMETLDYKPVVYVLHPTGVLASEFTLFNVPLVLKNMLAKVFVGISKRSIEEILEETNLNPRKLALENDKFPFMMFKDVVNELNVGVCLDTGHILAGISGDVNVEDLLEIFKHSIVEVHLHDGIFKKINGAVEFKYHLPLGTSGYDFRGFLEKLREYKFNGPIVLEMSLRDVEYSLKYLGVIK